MAHVARKTPDTPFFRWRLVPRHENVNTTKPIVSVPCSNKVNLAGIRKSPLGNFRPDIAGVDSDVGTRVAVHLQASRAGTSLSSAHSTPCTGSPIVGNRIGGEQLIDNPAPSDKLCIGVASNDRVVDHHAELAKENGVSIRPREAVLARAVGE